MRHAARRAALLLMMAGALAAEVKLIVQVIDPKTGERVAGLEQKDFRVTDSNAPRTVTAVTSATTPVDTLLLADSSVAGEVVRGPAADLIAELGEKEQMALVGYHSSADLVQDFTASKSTLLKALDGLKFGNTPRVLDAVYAALDEGFEAAVARRVLLLLTSGYEGGSRVRDTDVITLARRKGVAIHTLYLGSVERGLFEKLGRETGGAAVSLRTLGRRAAKPAASVFEILRSHYVVTIQGNLAPRNLKVEVEGTRKVFVSALPID